MEPINDKSPCPSPSPNPRLGKAGIVTDLIIAIEGRPGVQKFAGGEAIEEGNGRAADDLEREIEGKLVGLSRERIMRRLSASVRLLGPKRPGVFGFSSSFKGWTRKLEYSGREFKFLSWG